MSYVVTNVSLASSCFVQWREENRAYVHPTVYVWEHATKDMPYSPSRLSMITTPVDIQRGTFVLKRQNSDVFHPTTPRWALLSASKMKVDSFERKLARQSQADETCPPMANLALWLSTISFESVSNGGVSGLFSLGAAGFTVFTSSFEVLQCKGSASASAKATFWKHESCTDDFSRTILRISKWMIIRQRVETGLQCDR